MSTPARRLWRVVNPLVGVAILVGVGVYFADILSASGFDLRTLTVRYELLVPAGLLYLLAHLCWATFWVRLLHFEGVRVSGFAAVRAYYVSQVGKYFPVKGWVVVMRVGMLRHDAHAHALPVGVTAVYETLCSMAAGALVGVLLLPQLGVLPAQVTGQTTLILVVVALPLGLGVLNRVAVRLVSRRRSPAARALPSPSIFLLAQGLVHGVCGHCLLGLSLGLTVRAVVPDAPSLFETYPADLGANALAYVAGFLVAVAPGGLGPRETMLKLLLAPRLAAGLGPEAAAALAVVVALLLRVVWTTAEVALAGVLYLFRPPAAPIPHHIHHPELLDPTDQVPPPPPHHPATDVP
ncbi:MAG: hypothetical protein C0501_24105 [Isosphaera sp.]|nr:hypothetical protein [Isosphaera sp.]